MEQPTTGGIGSQRRVLGWGFSMRAFASAAASVLALAMAAPASAAVFIDNFEGYTVALNQGNFQGNWMVAGGTVDLVGPGLFAELCNAGSKCVDLDGSSANAGVFTSSAFELIAGETYTATYDLAANRRVGADDVLTVEFGTASAVYTLASTSASDPFATYSLSFTPVTTGAYSLSFSTAGGDNVGPLLDNVLVSAAIPEPATWAMMIMGFGGAGTLIRRRRRLLATA